MDLLTEISAGEDETIWFEIVLPNNNFAVKRKTTKNGKTATLN